MNDNHKAKVAPKRRLWMVVLLVTVLVATSGGLYLQHQADARARRVEHLNEQRSVNRVMQKLVDIYQRHDKKLHTIASQFKSKRETIQTDRILRFTEYVDSFQALSALIRSLDLEGCPARFITSYNEHAVAVEDYSRIFSARKEWYTFEDNEALSVTGMTDSRADIPLPFLEVPHEQEKATLQRIYQTWDTLDRIGSEYGLSFLYP